MKAAKPVDVNAYIALFPKNVQKKLEEIRIAIKKAAPSAEEVISYGMPAFKYKGSVIIYFAGYKNHIGFYATPAGHSAFEKELSVYKQGKGSVQFPLDQPVPLNLISRIVKFKVEQKDNQQKDLYPGLSMPALRALQNNGIKTLQQLAKHSEAEILKLHGIGKTAIPKLQKTLKEKGLSFKFQE